MEEEGPWPRCAGARALVVGHGARGGAKQASAPRKLALCARPLLPPGTSSAATAAPATGSSSARPPPPAGSAVGGAAGDTASLASPVAARFCAPFWLTFSFSFCSLAPSRASRSSSVSLRPPWEPGSLARPRCCTTLTREGKDLPAGDT